MKELKLYIIENILSIVFTLLIILWLVGIFVFHYGPIVHVLLLLASIVIMFRLMQWVKNK